MDTQEAFDLMFKNLSYGDYIPLPLEESRLVRQEFQINLPKGLNETIGDNETEFYFPCGCPACVTDPIAKGYQRVVIGDYGAYLEFSDNQIDRNLIYSKWSGRPNRPVKYLWYVPSCADAEELVPRIYYQQGKVAYADYKPGMWYIDVFSLKIRRGDEFIQSKFKQIMSEKCVEKILDPLKSSEK